MGQFSMWTYWRDKYGYAEALQEYYPELLEEKTILQYNLNQLLSAEHVIDSVMEELADAELYGEEE